MNHASFDVLVNEMEYEHFKLSIKFYWVLQALNVSYETPVSVI